MKHLWMALITLGLLCGTTAPAQAAPAVWASKNIYVYDKTPTGHYPVAQAAEYWDNDTKTNVNFIYTRQPCAAGTQCVTVTEVANLAYPAIGKASRHLTNGVVVSATIGLDSKYWKTENYAHERSLICHELGHILMGPGHSTHKNSCMQSINTGDKYPDADDLAKVRSLYKLP